MAANSKKAFIYKGFRAFDGLKKNTLLPMKKTVLPIKKTVLPIKNTLLPMIAQIVLLFRADYSGLPSCTSCALSFNGNVGRLYFGLPPWCVTIIAAFNVRVVGMVSVMVKSE